MPEITDTLGSFYSDFILRDLLTIIMPGAFVVFLIMHIFGKFAHYSVFLNDLSIIGIILVFGFFYFIGFICVSTFELIFHLFFRTFTTDEHEDFPKTKNHIIIFYRKLKKSGIRNWIRKGFYYINCSNLKHYENQIKFFSNIKCINERVIRTYERELIFYQMFGSFSIAFLFLFFFFLMNGNWFESGGCFIVFILLECVSVIHSERAKQWLNTLNAKKQKDVPNDPSEILPSAT